MLYLVVGNEVVAARADDGVEERRGRVVGGGEGPVFVEYGGAPRSAVQTNGAGTQLRRG